MADYAQFYVNGPYLHNLPGYSNFDLYAAADSQIRSVDLKNVKNEGLVRLRMQLEKARSVEAQFYALFGSNIKNAKDWNRLFFGAAASNTGQITNEDTLYSKIVKAINHRSVYNILNASESRDYGKHVKDAT